MGYFRRVPNLQYISLDLNNNSSLNYSEVKNLFRRAKLREDIFHNLTYFTKYQVIGDERPDNVAKKIYNDSELDWVVLISNNILDVYDEWPMTQNSFYEYIDQKYGSFDNASKTKHYETIEIRDSYDNIVLEKGLIVNQNFEFTYYDKVLSELKTVTDITKAVTFFEYEENIQNEKRNIYLIKPIYLNIILNDVNEIMTYKKSDQYINDNLKKASNTRLT